MSNRLPGLGDEVRHVVTGFQGIVVSYAKHVAGCDRLFVEPKVDRDGKLIDGAWFDIDMLKIVKSNAVPVIEYNRKAPGGIDLPKSR